MSVGVARTFIRSMICDKETMAVVWNVAKRKQTHGRYSKNPQVRT